MKIKEQKLLSDNDFKVMSIFFLLASFIMTAGIIITIGHLELVMLIWLSNLSFAFANIRKIKILKESIKG